jgi:fatty acid desaturase
LEEKTMTELSANRKFAPKPSVMHSVSTERHSNQGAADGLRKADKERDHILHRELRNRLEQAGCFRPAKWAYGITISIIFGVGIISYAVLLTGPELVPRIALAALIAFVSVQAGFIAHDAGDGGVTRNRRISFGLRHALMSFVGALSSSYFNYLHKVHHLTLARGGRGIGGGDVAFNPYEIRWFKKLVSWNGLVFLIATASMRCVTFRLESLRYVWKNPKGTTPDRFLMALHGLVWLVLPLPFIGLLDTFINYALVALIAGPYVGTVLILNHEGMSKASSLRHLSMLERVTRSTRNLGRSHWSDFVFGGVNNHIEHHLFPQIPAMRLRQARSITRDFCREHDISYVETSFGSAVVEAARHFRTLPKSRLVAEALS